MAKISRQTHKTFGGLGSSDNFAQFGSLVAADPIKTKDIATIQSLPAWDEGFQSSIFGANKNLLLEDLNAFAFEHSTQVAYMLQAGIPEWDSATTYFKGSIVQRTAGSDATAELYASLIDDNLGNALPVQASNANWQFINTQSLPAGSSIEYMGVVLPSGFLWEDGSAQSRVAFATLFAALNLTLSGNLLIGMQTITGLPSTANLQVGWFAGGTGIAPGAKIQSIDSGSQVTLTLPALSTQTAIPINFGPWGLGDGSTTFNLPDTRRRVGVGTGGAGTAVLGAEVGDIGGEETHVLTIPEIPAHTHSTTLNTESVGGGGFPNFLRVGGSTGSVAFASSSVGGSGAHNNMQPSYVAWKIIKV